MKYTGTILRVERSRGGVTVIVDTPVGLRGIELDRTLWLQILEDFDLSSDDALVGWAVEYDPAHGDLEVVAPEEDPPDVP